MEYVHGNIGKLEVMNFREPHAPTAAKEERCITAAHVAFVYNALVHSVSSGQTFPSTALVVDELPALKQKQMWIASSIKRRILEIVAVQETLMLFFSVRRFH